MHVLVHSCHNVPGTTHTALINWWHLEYENDKDVKAAEDDEDAAYAEDKNNASPSQYQPEDKNHGLVPDFTMVYVNAIKKHCLMIPYHTHRKFLMQVIDQDKWVANVFRIE